MQSVIYDTCYAYVLLSDGNNTLTTLLASFNIHTLCPFLMAQNLSGLLLSLTSFDYYHFQEETFLFSSFSRREIPYFL